MRFLLKSGWDLPTSGARPVVILRRDSWDDFGFKTLFDAELYMHGQEAVELGQVKIMRRDAPKGTTELPGSQFSQLGPEYCSLGQTAEYYAKLAELPARTRKEYLLAMRDAAFDRDIRREFMGKEAWEASLTRFGPALHALKVGKNLVEGVKRTVGLASFAYVREGVSPLTVDFSFDDRAELPGRSNVIIGYNGVGKTHLLANIARAASEGGVVDGEGGALVGQDATFGAVIAVSYSAFDDFLLPQDKTRGQDEDVFARNKGRTELFGYVYCGLRRVDESPSRSDLIERRELKSLDEIEQELLNALERARHKVIDDRRILADCLELLEQEPSFGRIGVLPSTWLEVGAKPGEEIRLLSTGHKIVLNIVAQLAAHLKPRSIVLLDEPETHLHPPLLAAMLRVLQRLLDVHDSFMIIATHSPVVLQEVPARSVRVLTRFGDSADVEPPEIETFGANVGTITRHVFSLDNSATDYQGVLADLAARLTLDEIEELFADGMSDQARALVLRAKREPS